MEDINNPVVKEEINNEALGENINPEVIIDEKKLRRKKIKGWILLLILLVGLGVGGYWWCANKRQELHFNNLQSKKNLVVGIKSGIFGFNPDIENYETSTMSVNFNIFNSLVEFDESYRIVPALAETWENPDELTWRFKLRRGVLFHNGDEFNASDVEYTLNQTMTDKENVFNDLLAGVDKVEVIDDYTIDVVTKEATPVMLNKLVDVLILSKEYQESGLDNGPIGTGAYKLAEHKGGEYIRLIVNENYWKNKPAMETVEFRVIDNDEERIAELLAGNIDIAESLPLNQKSNLEEASGIKVVLKPSTRVIYLSFDFRSQNSYGYLDGKNPISNLLVRKAMYKAIDEQKIIDEIMEGMAVSASQFISADIFGYNPSIKRMEYDQEEARALLSEAGYEDGFQIELDCPNDRYVNDEEICKEVSRQLREIGIEVELNIQPKADFFPKVLGRNTSFYLLGWATDTADGGEIFDYLLRTVDEDRGFGTYNNGYYSNPLVDVLAEKTAQSIDNGDRLRKMQEGFAIAAEDVAWIPLHLEELLYGVVDGVDWKPRADVKIKVEDVR